MNGVRSIHISPAVLIQTTPILCAEPLKKKKKIDPQLLKQREERRRKKIEKQIRRLEKNSRQLKPIDELEVPLTLIDQKKYVFFFKIILNLILKNFYFLEFVQEIFQQQINRK